MSGVHPTAQRSGPLAEFTLDFAKAMLRTGYYQPDHPQAHQARTGLYQTFSRVLGDRAGLTYLVGRQGERRTIIVEGYESDPLTLDKIMIGGMAELFTPKLLEFFDRRRLLSFSLRAGISHEEFDAFVILMSEPPTAGQATDERKRVTQALLDRHIFSVSTLFEADVVGRERRLAWRVELALSRLGRDLHLLPLYKRASREKIQETKIQLIDEVIRPLRTPKLLADLLVNCDVLARDIVVLKEAQIEREIIAQIPPQLLAPTARQVLDGLQQLDATAGVESDEMAGRHRLVLRDLLDRLARAEIEVEGELLEAAVSREVFTWEELPKALQQALKRRRVFDSFLAKRDAYLQHLGRLPSGKPGMQFAALAQVVFPELLRRGQYEVAAQMLEALRSGKHDDGAADTVARLDERIAAVLGAEETVRRLLDAIGDERLERSDRDALVVLLGGGGAAAVSGLVRLYGATESVSIRGSVFEAMKQIGTPALTPFLVRLSAIEPEWSAIHHVLVALEGQSDPALADSIRPFLRHENAHVRQAALTRVFQLLGPASEDLLITALTDPDPATRHAAVAYLGKLRSRHPAVLRSYAAALLPESGTGPEQEHEEEVLVEVCRCLSGLGDVQFPDGSSVERLLLNALSQEGKKKRISQRISGMFHRPSPLHAERVRVAICEALGTVGTVASVDALRELVSGETGSVAEAAEAAAARIAERVSS